MKEKNLQKRRHYSRAITFREILPKIPEEICEMILPWNLKKNQLLKIIIPRNVWNRISDTSWSIEERKFKERESLNSESKYFLKINLNN